MKPTQNDLCTDIYKYILCMCDSLYANNPSYSTEISPFTSGPQNLALRYHENLISIWERYV